VPVIAFDELPFSVIARELVGRDHGVGVCVLLVEAAPGDGPSLHKHPYEEILIVQEGRARFVLGDEEREVGAGEIVIAPADVPHAFTNIGDGPLRQIDIHVSPQFATDWLERPASAAADSSARPPQGASD
jgi:quercetin dioxygenase-like cupin family protein